jgi:hypothetical protein
MTISESTETGAALPCSDELLQLRPPSKRIRTMNVRLTDYDATCSASTPRAYVTLHQHSTTAPDKSQTS